MAQVATAEILLKLNTRDYDQQLAQVQRQFNAFNQEYSVQINTRNADAALQTTLGFVQNIVGALKGLGQSAIAEAQDFQGALNSLKAVSGGTEDQLTKLKEVAIQVGAATTQTPTQVLKAADAFSRLGFSIDQATEAAPGLVALAESTGSSLESSAEVAAKALTIYGDALDAVTAANTLTATINRSAVASIDEFNQLLSKAGGVAKNNAISFQELSAAFGAIRGTGSTPETAATALKNIITNLTTPTENAKKALEGFLNVRDESGKFRGLEVVLSELIVKLNKLDDATRDKKIVDIFGRESLGAVAGLVAQGIDKVSTTFNDVQIAAADAGSAATSAAIRLQGVGAALNALQGSVDTVKLKIGDTLVPALQAGAIVATDLINIFLGLPEPVQKTVTAIGVLTVGVGSLVAGLSVLRTAIQQNIFAQIGLSATAFKETLIDIGNATKGFADFASGRSFLSASGKAKIDAEQLQKTIKDLDSSLADSQIRFSQSSDKEDLLKRRFRAEDIVAQEKETIALRAKLASEEAQSAAVRIANEQGVTSASVIRAKAEAARLRITAEAAAGDAIAARTTANKTAAELASAQATNTSAAAEIRSIQASRASAVAKLEAAQASVASAAAESAQSSAFNLSAVKQSVLTAATTAGTFAKEAYAVATGKVAAAEVSAATAFAASVFQLAAYAAAILVVVENLKLLGLFGDESQKQLKNLNKELDKINAPEEKPTVEKNKFLEEQLGIDTSRFGFNAPLDTLRQGLATGVSTFANIPGLNLVLPKVQGKDVTSTALEQQRETIASAEANRRLFSLFDQGQVSVSKYSAALKDQSQIESLSVDQKIQLVKQLEEEVAKREAVISAAKASGLSVEGSIAPLQKQNEITQRYIALLKGGAIPETKEQTIANDLLSESIEKASKAQEKANDEAELAIAKTKALVAERQLAGELTAESGAAELAKVESDALATRIQTNAQFVNALKSQQTSLKNVLSAEQVTKLQKDIADAEKEGYDLRFQLATNALNERKRISDEEIKAIREEQTTQEILIEKQVLEAKKLALAGQLTGQSSPLDTRNTITASEEKALEERIAIRQKLLTDLKSSQTIESKEQKQQIIAAEKEILGLEIDLQQRRLQSREEEKQQTIKTTQSKLVSQKQALELFGKEEELLLQQQLSSREITQSQYDAASLKLRESSLKKRLELNQGELKSAKDLLAKGYISQEEYEKQVLDLRQQSISIQTELVKVQIDEQKRLSEETVKRISKELEASKLLAQIKEQDLSFQKESLTLQSQLYEGQQSLNEAQSQLTTLRLGFAKEDATNQSQSLEISRQIFDVEKAGALAKLENEKRLLDIRIQQQRIESEINQSQAGIAVLEAKAQLEAAKARNASAEELASLQQVLQLKENIYNNTVASAQTQEELNRLQKDTLSVNAEITKEQLARKESILDLQRLGVEPLSDSEKKKLAEDESKSREILGGLSKRSFGDGGDKAKAIFDAILDNIGNKSLLRDLGRAGGFAADIAGLVGQLPLDRFSSTQLKSVESTIDKAQTSQEVVDLLKQLIEVVQKSDRPNISVSSANPIDDLLQILRA